MIPIKADKIPRATIRRLAMYLQTLEHMAHDGVELCSSEQLAKACDVNPSQIRKDLTYFGEFGVRGVGYNIKQLMESIASSLGIDRQWNCVLIGVGNLGRALLQHRKFTQRQYNIVGIFDCDPFKIGDEVAGMEIICSKKLSPTYIAEKKVEIGIITTPPERAQRAVDYLVAAGVRGILNYSTSHVFVPEGVFVEYVDFFNHLYALSFNISQTAKTT